ncbi:MAG: hypothetical protein POELPBGB_03980 [Bacteroidia bacterium]|nr:hypothetical protein [Bacteroidia bacterium]
MLEILDLRAYARAYTEVMRAQDDSQVSAEARALVAPVLEQIAAERAARRGR